MFSLNKSLSKLKSALEEAQLGKKTSADKSSKQNDTKQKKAGKPTKSAKKNASKGVGGGGQPNKGVIMIKNFPHGFYEKQMFDYFSQFGEVTRLKIARSRKTGKPRSYGFIEFQFEDVAKIAAETMNNYIMFDHVVKSTLLPEEKVPKNLFHNWNRPFISSVKTHKVAHNRAKNDAKEYHLLCKRLKRVHAMAKTLADQGIEFKCVIANRPTNIHKPSKSTTAVESSHKAAGAVVASKAVSPVKEVKVMKQTALKSSTTTAAAALAQTRPVTRRRIILPKFKVVKAGLNCKN